MQLSGFNAEQILQRQALSLCEQTSPLPRGINFGSGTSFKLDMLNIDISPKRAPDVTCDLGQPFDFEKEYQTKRFGKIKIPLGHFNYIEAHNILEHIPNLIVAMTNCLDFLEIGGIMDILVPYDLSYGAWQDPTHLRAFNERSWLYYTDWCWYVNWVDYRFDLIELMYGVSEYGNTLMQQYQNDIEAIARIPRSIDFIRVKLRKRETTIQEKLYYQQMVK